MECGRFFFTPTSVSHAGNPIMKKSQSARTGVIPVILLLPTVGFLRCRNQVHVFLKPHAGLCRLRDDVSLIQQNHALANSRAHIWDVDAGAYHPHQNNPSKAARAVKTHSLRSTLKTSRSGGKKVSKSPPRSSLAQLGFGQRDASERGIKGEYGMRSLPCCRQYRSS